MLAPEKQAPLVLTLSNEEFLEIVQSATDHWAGLAHATGGSLKPWKCFWYLSEWMWKKGKALLKTLSELPQTSLQIPQLDGTRVPICIKNVQQRTSHTMSVNLWPQDLNMWIDFAGGSFLPTMLGWALGTN